MRNAIHYTITGDVTCVHKHTTQHTHTNMCYIYIHTNLHRVFYRSLVAAESPLGRDFSQWPQSTAFLYGLCTRYGPPHCTEPAGQMYNVEEGGREGGEGGRGGREGGRFGWRDGGREGEREKGMDG